MKVVLVGGTGFIGTHLAELLMKMGDQVIVIDPAHQPGLITLEQTEVIQNYREKLLVGARIFQCRFEELDADFLEKEQPDVIVHLAAHPIECPFEHELSLTQLTQDVHTSYEIVKAVKKLPKTRLVYLSSIFSYGDHDYSITEGGELHPKTPYGISKAVGEFLVKSQLTNWNIIRTTSVYGFGDLNNRVTQIILNKAMANEDFWINNGAWLDFIYIKDLVEGILKVIHSNKSNEVFHISGGYAQTIQDFVSELHKYFKLMYEIKTIDDRPHRGTMDNSKARILLNWKPQYNLQKGVYDYVETAKNYGCA